MMATNLIIAIISFIVLAGILSFLNWKDWIKNTVAVRSQLIMLNAVQL